MKLYYCLRIDGRWRVVASAESLLDLFSQWSEWNEPAAEDHVVFEVIKGGRS